MVRRAAAALALVLSRMRLTMCCKRSFVETDIFSSQIIIRISGSIPGCKNNVLHTITTKFDLPDELPGKATCLDGL
jgi:hypothetical protein